jgi:hypothetical protein
MGHLVRLVAALALLPAVLLGLRYWRARSRSRLAARDAAEPLAARAVMLPEDRDDTEARQGHRSGEAQELRRRIVHGPYRPIADRGAPSQVRTEESS